jgi:hypothetical protein
VALARSGRFEEAHAAALEGLAVAESTGDHDQAAEIRTRAALYQKRMPYLESTK